MAAMRKKKAEQAERRRLEQERIDKLVAEQQAAEEAEHDAGAKAAVSDEPPSLSTGGNPEVWLEIEVGATGLHSGETIGRVVCELFADVVPRTAENFRCLCTGEKGETKRRGDRPPLPLHYRGSTVHRVVPGFVCQGGDFQNGDGTGGESIYGECFVDENFHAKHVKAGLLSMANAGKNTNGSQFFITLAAAPHLDGKHVVFGQVVEGMAVVRQMEALGSKEGETSKRIVIKQCGQQQPKSTGRSHRSSPTPNRDTRPSHRRDEARRDNSRRRERRASRSRSRGRSRSRDRRRSRERDRDSRRRDRSGSRERSRGDDRRASEDPSRSVAEVIEAVDRVEKEIKSLEREAGHLGGDKRQFLHPCEVCEVKLTELLLRLDAIETSEAREEARRVKALGVRLVAAKTECASSI